jgi:hypothetical protein
MKHTAKQPAMDTRTLLTHVTDGGAVYIGDNHKFADASIVVRIDASTRNEQPELIAAELVRRWNSHNDLLAALQDLVQTIEYQAENNFLDEDADEGEENDMTRARALLETLKA